MLTECNPVHPPLFPSTLRVGPLPPPVPVIQVPTNQSPWGWLYNLFETGGETVGQYEAATALSQESFIGSFLQPNPFTTIVETFVDIIGFFASFFAGRPKLAATADIANAISYPSPIIQHLAAGARQSYYAGIPLSSKASFPITAFYYKEAYQEFQQERAALGLPPMPAKELNALFAQLLYELGNPGHGTTAIDEIMNLWNRFQAHNVALRKKLQTPVKRIKRKGGIR